ncbi:hypothetical protein BKG58_10440 [Mycobacteroides abscessus subsp. abscessus]|nr:hypothetical protein BKG58_10440 [Mycobacteroides abscessus subsp. abscessus]
MIAEQASKVVPFTGSLLVLVVGDEVLTDDEGALDEVDVDPAVGIPWIPSCVHPATSAVETATTAVHFVFMARVFLNCQLVAGGG